jgi:hypothetical protein
MTRQPQDVYVTGTRKSGPFRYIPSSLSVFVRGHGLLARFSLSTPRIDVCIALSPASRGQHTPVRERE